ncbi:hypothetical protein KP509_1Z245600 [Ceratopteris richardii]|nr:hypothetical protein KP509_1Z313900 [Ceratopteris richardii]KAH6554933.1 hypothetical protein KP509_1Z295800 [Ceratopteris richardii]KAH6555041.1 hypothetical protein KP509_1Z287000 [Ceratopteris richardii]KAH6555549.1 hypothetical protein KP509_1Z245600 [Ceratopteris richardii]
MERWLFSTNHKDIGTLHLIFGATAGVMGTCLLVSICMTDKDSCFGRKERLSPYCPHLMASTIHSLLRHYWGRVAVFPTYGFAFTFTKHITSYSGGAVDLAIFSPHLSGVLFILGFINFITIILNTRGPGMTMYRLPLSVWFVSVTAFLLLPSPPVPAEVHTPILSGLGIISYIVSTFFRKPVFGYSGMVYAMISIGVLGFTVRAYYTLTVGLDVDTRAYFTAATMTIAVLTGIKVPSRIVIMWGGSIEYKTLMSFAVGFIFSFTIGGPTGIVLANSGIDVAPYDTYYVVAYFYHASFMGAVFALSVGFHYRIANLTFSLTHFLGLSGMPCRIPDYPDAYVGWNALSSFGLYVLVSGIPRFFIVVFKTSSGGNRCAPSPRAGE